MPEIDRFSGMVVSVYCEAGGKHNWPHIHVRYSGTEAAYKLDGERIEGSLPNAKEKELKAWMEAHRPALEEIWKLAHAGKRIPKVKEVESK